MTDFTAYNSTTHPLILAVDDYNNLLGHGLEKTCTYICRKNGSYFEAINGSTGVITYGGSGNAGSVDGTSSKAVIDAAIANAASMPGKVYVKTGAYGTIALAAFANGCDVEFERGVPSTVTYSVAAAYNGVITDNRNQTRLIYHNGTATGLAAYTFKVKQNGTDYEAYDNKGVLTYGGASDAGSVDGAELYAVINAAVTATNTAGGGIVFLDLPGEHTLNANILMKSKVTLCGLGKYATILKAKNSLDDDVIATTSSATTYTGIVIRDLGINGNEANQAAVNYPVTPAKCGIFLADCDDAEVCNCYIYDTKMSGIWLLAISATAGYTVGGKFHHNTFSNCSWNGIVIGGSGGLSHYTICSDNFVELSADVGITVFGNYNIVSNCVFKGCQGALGDGSVNTGWAVGMENGNYNLVTDCNISDCDTGCGLAGATADYNVFQNSTCYDLDDNCANITSSEHCVVDGIKAMGTCLRLAYIASTTSAEIINCICHGATGAAVYLAADATGVWVEGNDFNGAADDIDIAAGGAATYGNNRWKDASYDNTPP